MRKIITIGETVLDTLFVDNQPVKSFMGGRIANTAALLGKMGHPTFMVSECCTDHIGNLIVEQLNDSGVDTRSVDRYTKGATAFSAIFKTDAKYKITNYRNYPEDRFRVVWPRIENNDIVLFGSYYSIDLPGRDKLYDLLRHAVDMKAILIYLPGCQHGMDCRLTKVMPGILENFEISNLVIANQHDVNDVYDGETGDEAYKNHIEFYCPNFLNILPSLDVNVHTRRAISTAKAPRSTTDEPLLWQAQFVAGVIDGIIRNDVIYSDLAREYIANSTLQQIVASALENIKY
ncbi:MAG: hypothetical protein HUK12_03610 [Muribaculaceae bacterium]|nr:hypothetical protein [Muribaculaceae bacterium]